MVYNPLFEEEVERAEELKVLRDAIRSRAAKHQFVELAKKVIYFGKTHPIATMAALVGLLRFSAGGRRR